MMMGDSTKGIDCSAGLNRSACTLTEWNHTVRVNNENPLCAAVVTETYPPDVNGCSMTLGRLVDGLLAAGNRVQLFRPRHRPMEGPWRDHRLTVHPQRGVPIPCYRHQNFGWWARARIKHVWQRERPDAVYVATEGPLGLSAVKAASELDIPIVSGFHTNFHRYASHYHLGWFTPLAMGYLRHFHNKTSCTLVPTRTMRHDLMENGCKNVDVVGRGVDTRLYALSKRDRKLRESWGLEDGDLAAVYVGRVAGEKNMDLAVRAFQAVQSVRRNARFIVVGDGPMRTELQRRHPEFIYCGVKTGEQLAARYASSDLFLFPSLSETFGNVTMEAAASGLAVVTFDYAAAREHLTDGESAALVPFGNEEAYIDRAREVASSDVIMSKLGKNARAVAEAIDWDNICARFESILRRWADKETRQPCELPAAPCVEAE